MLLIFRISGLISYVKYLSMQCLLDGCQKNPKQFEDFLKHHGLVSLARFRFCFIDKIAESKVRRKLDVNQGFSKVSLEI